eukprot:7567504-Ditylum_brightwellii.AAC.1
MAPPRCLLCYHPSLTNPRRPRPDFCQPPDTRAVFTSLLCPCLIVGITGWNRAHDAITRPSV